MADRTERFLVGPVEADNPAHQSKLEELADVAARTPGATVRQHGSPPQSLTVEVPSTAVNDLKAKFGLALIFEPDPPLKY